MNRRRTARIALSVALLTAAVVAGMEIASARLNVDSHVSAEQNQQSEANTHFRARALPVKVAPVTLEKAYRRALSFTGRVEPARESALGFEIAGRLMEVSVDQGDRVAAGDVLARLDTARLDARQAELDAALAGIDTEVALARLVFERRRRLIKQGAASQQVLDDAREDLRRLEAAMTLARARLASNAVEVAKSSLRAPFDAVVVARHADEGRVLETGRPVLQVIERAAPEARIGIANGLDDTLDVGDAVEVEVHERVVLATVKTVLPVRSVGERTVDVILALHVDPMEVRSGDLVRLRLDQQVPGAGFWMPMEALSAARRGLWSVSVAEALDVPPLADSPRVPTHRVSRRTVELVHANAERVFVRGPLTDGELLLVAGVHRVTPGQVVRIARAEVR